MFERFTARARSVVRSAQEVARARGDSDIGTEHLLLALTVPDTGLASQVLAAVSVTTEQVTDQLAERAQRPRLVTEEDLLVLQELGIDAAAILSAARGAETGQPSPEALASVVAGAMAAEERPEVLPLLSAALERLRPSGAKPPVSGPKHLPFNANARKVLELSLREALSLKDGYIGTEHLLLGLLRQGGLGAELLAELGVDLDDVRRRAIDARPGAA